MFARGCGVWGHTLMNSVEIYVYTGEVDVLCVGFRQYGGGYNICRPIKSYFVERMLKILLIWMVVL